MTQTPGPRRVACLGDSITRGRVSANYVRELERTHGGGYRFSNHGVNGDLAWNLLQRLDAVVAERPDVVTLLIGTNDANSEGWTGRQLKGLRRYKKVPQSPSLDWYVDCLDSILTRLKGETTATVVLLDLPMLGEEVHSHANARVEAYNEALRDVAGRHRVPVLPLHDELVGLIPPDHRPPAFERGDVRLMLEAALRRLVLRQSFNRIAKRHGLAVTTDHVHLNDDAGAVAAGLLGDYLDAQLAPAERPEPLPE